MSSYLLQSDASALGGLVIFGGIWLGACFIVGLIGKDRNIGFTGSFFLSVFLSPVIGFIVALVSPYKKPPPKAYTCPHCKLQSFNPQYYCVRCLKDKDGHTVDENKERFK